MTKINWPKWGPFGTETRKLVEEGYRAIDANYTFIGSGTRQYDPYWSCQHKWEPTGDRSLPLKCKFCGHLAIAPIG